MNHWLQTKLYACAQCGERYLHDKAYQHASFRCLMRPGLERKAKPGGYAAGMNDYTSGGEKHDTVSWICGDL